MAQVTISRRARLGHLEDRRRAARRAPAAPRRGHRHHRGPAGPRPGRDPCSRAADRTEHLQIVQNWGAQAGARTNHLCFDLYDLPQIPHRVAEELGGAARFLIREGECPYCRHVREEVRRPDHLLYADDHAVAFAPYASRSPFEVWVVPRRHDADFARASDRDVAATAEALRRVLGRLSASLDGPPYNVVLHTAPLREQVDATYHWHWEIHPRLREIAGLELGTGLPVNPVSPEDAVDELRAGPDDGGVGGASAPMTGTGGAVTRSAPASSQRLGTPGLRSRGVLQSRQRSIRGRRSLRARTTTGPARGPHRERRLGSRRGVPLRRGAVREAPARDLRLPAAHAQGPGARCGPDAGRVRQGLPRLRLAGEARECAGVALPDRPPRRPGQPPAQPHRPLRAARRRDAQTLHRRPSTS